MSDAPKDAAVPKKSKKLMFIIIGVVVLAVAGGGILFLRAKAKAAEEGDENVKHGKKELKQPIFVQMDDFLVNLPGRGGEHFLQARVVLRTADPTTEGKIKVMLPLIRDRLLTVLSQRSMDILATPDGKSALTKDMALVINAVLDPQLTLAYALSRDPSGNELRNLERIGVLSREMTAAGAGKGHSAVRLMEVNESDLPVQAVLFSSFIMQ